MLRSLFVCPDPLLREQLLTALEGRTDVAVVKTLDRYPPPHAFARLMRAHAPELLFLSMENHESVETVISLIDTEFQGVQRVGVHPTQDAAVLRQALRLGMREVLSLPIEREDLRQALKQAEEQLARNPISFKATDHLLSFFPAKPGVGASTIAANAAWAFGARTSTRVLLSDFDVYSGVIGFMFNVEHGYTLLDAARRSPELDDNLWPQLVRQVGSIDLLLSGNPQCGSDLRGAHVSRIMEFATRNYDIICADLSGALDELSLEVLRESSQIFLVTTPELPALRLARLKVVAFKELALEAKTSLVVNRVSPRSELSLQEIEETVGLPVLADFPCNYACVARAIREGHAVKELAPGMQKFTQALLGQQSVDVKKPGLIESFSLFPLKLGLRKAN